MKIVTDSNVIISAFLWQKDVKEIFDLARNHKFVICVNQEILNEIQKVLHYHKFYSKLKLIGKTPEIIISELLEIIEIYPTKNSSEIIIKEDPADDKFLLCGLASGADFIISGDKHLLKLKSFQNIQILTPRQFINRLKKRK